MISGADTDGRSVDSNVQSSDSRLSEAPNIKWQLSRHCGQGRRMIRSVEETNCIWRRRYVPLAESLSLIVYLGYSR